MDIENQIRLLQRETASTLAWSQTSIDPSISKKLKDLRDLVNTFDATNVEEEARMKSCLSTLDSLDKRIQWKTGQRKEAAAKKTQKRSELRTYSCLFKH